MRRIFTGFFACRISEPSADLEDLQLLSPEEREKRRSFEAKSKLQLLGNAGRSELMVFFSFQGKNIITSSKQSRWQDN